MDDEICVCARLRRATRTITRAYDEALAPVDLTVTQYSLLRWLERLTDPTLAELAEATAHERSALWRTLQPLLRDGLVEASASEGGRRQRLTLKAAGRERLAAALPLWRAAQARVGAVLGPRRSELIELLAELEANG